LKQKEDECKVKVKNVTVVDLALSTLEGNASNLLQNCPQIRARLITFLSKSRLNALATLKMQEISRFRTSLISVRDNECTTCPVLRPTIVLVRQYGSVVMLRGALQKAVVPNSKDPSAGTRTVLPYPSVCYKLKYLVFGLWSNVDGEEKLIVFLS
jgi:hypothetical protein